MRESRAGVSPPIVEEVRDREGVEAFVRLPFDLHRGDPHWVPPLLAERRAFLDRRRNPVMEFAEVRLFMARRGSRVVGTIAAIDNPRYRAYRPDDGSPGFFGLFECEDDPGAAAALLDAAARWLRARGLEEVRGPVNLTTNDVVGLLVEGFDDDPTVMMPHNPPYYAGLLEGWGLRRLKDLYAFEVGREQAEGIFAEIAARLARRGTVTVRHVNLSRFREELEFVRRCYNESWKNNWGFVPWTDSEIDAIARELKPLIDPRLALVGMVNGEPAGISISVPDANEGLKSARGRLFPLGLAKILWRVKVRGCRRLRVLALGVLPSFRRLGLEAILVERTVRRALELGYRTAELGWVLEDNEAILRTIERVGARRTKTYRVFGRAL